MCCFQFFHGGWQYHDDVVGVFYCVCGGGLPPVTATIMVRGFAVGIVA